jgi:23S rRNA pseudouridine1911/1915/1917 synthase
MPDGLSETRETIVDAELAGLRVDTFLGRAFPDRSRTFFQQLIKDGRVTVGGQQKPPSYVVSEGERVVVVVPPADDPWPIPQSIPLHILYEDEQVIVINKPAGLVVHPAAGNPDGTLVNALLHHCRGTLSGIGGVKRPGIVHRLDRDTSGVMVVAKTDKAHHSLGRQLQARKMGRRYIALALGTIKEDYRVIEGAIGRDPDYRIRRMVGGEAPREAVTYLRVLRRAHGATLLDVKLGSGRTHQIRVHLSHIGYPVVGDDLYGGAAKRLIERLKPDQREARLALKNLNRPFLHAWRLQFGHPSRGGYSIFHAPLPPALNAVLRALFDTDDPATLGLDMTLEPEPN